VHGRTSAGTEPEVKRSKPWQWGWAGMWPGVGLHVDTTTHFYNYFLLQLCKDFLD